MFKKMMITAAFAFATVAAPALADPVPPTPGTPAPAGDYSLTFNGSVFDGSGIITTDATGHATAATGTISSGSDIYTILGISAYAGADNNLYVTPAYVTFAGLSFTTDLGVDFNLFNYGDGTYGLLNSAENTVGYPDPRDIVTANVAAVPEPATWALMLIGFGAVGLQMRRKRQPAQLMQAA